MDIIIFRRKILKNYNMDEQVKNIKELSAYEIKTVSDIEELSARAVILEHKKTKARVFCMLSDDDNKVFTIGFRTPSKDSTGVAHILEHSVLCGSKKFPAKDPFVELVKGSLNTFLNAITYPDKTVYPVASCNDKDFDNLVDVYLDAVLYPNVYTEEKIFRQEGWHYELVDEKGNPDENGDIILNGVVYNEMKGAFSSADSVLERAITKTLFKGHSYGEESGGDPDYIPSLTYEKFLDMHSKYYHPSNSYIYLYGDMDMAKKLERIDREYLDKFEYRFVDSKIENVKELESIREENFEYPITEAQSEEDATYLSWSTLVGGELDPILYMGFQILEYVLLDVPGAALRQALIDAGIGEDVYGGYANGILEPYFGVIAKNTNLDRKAEFLAVIEGTLRKLADEGLDREAIKAAMNIFEFKAREADYGSYPKGLMYGLSSFDTWLYDDDPTKHLRFEGIFKTLREETDNNYFENLIKKYLLDNKNTAIVTMVPKKGLTTKKDQELKEKLKELKATLSKEELKKIYDDTIALKKYQSEPSSEEALLKIPMLSRDDISREVKMPVYKETEVEASGKKIPVIYSNVSTTGINYLKIVFNIDFANEEEIKHIALLREILGYIDTKKQSYSLLSTSVNLNSGGIAYSIETVTTNSNPIEHSFLFCVNAKILYGKESWLYSTVSEVLTMSKLDDKKRIKDIIAEVKSGLKDRLVSSGHMTALNRAGSYISKELLFGDLTKGISYLNFLESIDLEKDFEKIYENLLKLSKKIFNINNLLLHTICDEEGYKTAFDGIEVLAESLEKEEDAREKYVLQTEVKNEGFGTASRVNYVARFGNFVNHGFKYTGVLRVFKVLLSYDYLWNNIRVKGGAYGCSAIFGKSGNSGFVSYRDPNMANTNKIYEGIIEYAKNFTANEREMTKSVIGAISELDTPLTPAREGMKGLSAYYSKVRYEDMVQEREEVLNTCEEDIRALVPLLESVLSDKLICAIGNEDMIEKDRELFKEVKHLYKD